MIRYFNTYGEARDYAIRRYMRGAEWVEPVKRFVLLELGLRWSWIGELGYLEKGLD